MRSARIDYSNYAPGTGTVCGSGISASGSRSSFTTPKMGTAVHTGVLRRDAQRRDCRQPKQAEAH